MNSRKIFVMVMVIGMLALPATYAETASDNNEKTKTPAATVSEIGAAASQPADGEHAEKAAEVSGNIMDEILTGVEKRYSGKGFIAYFKQQSTIKAMDITDSAEGKVFIKKPGMMRWEYEKPDKQIILTDGEELWIFKPEDNQVMTGRAPSYFGDGKGGSILSNIRIIREKFTVSAEIEKDSDYYQLILLPKEKKPELASIRLFITKKEYDIERIITYNVYEDETLIEMTHLQFDQTIDESVFSFQIPEGADVVELEE